MFRNLFVYLFISASGIFGFSAVSFSEDYVVGAHLPLTGAFARAGQAYREGMLVAEHLHNLNNETKVRFDIVDDESSDCC